MNKSESVRSVTTLGSVAAESYCGQLHRYLTAKGGRHNAADLAQEVYLRLIRIPLSGLICNPEAYIISVARQVVIEFYRRDKRSRARLCIDSEQLERLAENPHELSADEPARWVSSSQLLERFLSDLPPAQADALLLHERDGLSYAQVAERLDVSERAVERYLTKAREKLHTTLAQERDHDKGTQPRQ
jgi:RNA polymerase sigma factor (sigma-70 family)